MGFFPGWATTPPTIDGTIGGPEWSGAATYNITLGVNPVVLYLMNDADYLYMAVDNQADTSLNPLDYELLLFDDEGGTPPMLSDGTWNAATCPSTEGALAVGDLSGSLPADEVFEGTSASGNCAPENATAVVAGAYSNASGHMVYEMRIDLASSELHAQPGQTFGAYVEVSDGGTLTLSGASPPGADYSDPSTFLPLTLASPPVAYTAGWAITPPTIDGTIGPGEWNDALTLDIGPVGTPVNLYLMNDADYLYMAVDDQANPNLDLGDYAGLIFEDEGGTPPLLGDGTWNAVACPSTEGAFIFGNLTPGFPSNDLFVGISQAGECSADAAAGLSGAYDNLTGHMVYEARIDLSASELHAMPGETFGAGIYCYDNGPQVPTGVLPPTLSVLDASTLATLTLASPPAAVPRNSAALRTQLEAARPDPFGPSTELRYALREAEPVKIEVFTVRGRRVVDLVDGTMTAGEHMVRWSGRDAVGHPVADGIYYVRMRAEGLDQTETVVRIN